MIFGTGATGIATGKSCNSTPDVIASFLFMKSPIVLGIILYVIDLTQTEVEFRFSVVRIKISNYKMFHIVPFAHIDSMLVGD